MKHLSPAGRRLAGVVTVALAVTAGTAATTATALAEPRAVTAAASEQGVEPFALGVDEMLYGSGANGFVSAALTADGTDLTFQWRRSADGAATPLPWPRDQGGSPLADSGSDRVAVQTGRTAYRILDMAGGAPVDIDTSFVGPSADPWQLAGDTLALVRWDGAMRDSLHLVSKPAGTVVHRQVRGLPADADILRVETSPAGVLVVRYEGTVGGTKGLRLAVVDLAGAQVVEDRAVPGFYANSGIAVSATHLAWSVADSEDNVTLVTARRGTTESTRHTTLRVNGDHVPVSLLGDWAVYEGSRRDLSAVSLKDGTTVTGLLGKAGELSGAGDGLLAQGATAEHGAGVYRIGLGADGRPAPTLLATEGARTPVTVADQQVPATAGFATAGSKAVLRWRLGRGDVVVSLQLTHKATGKTWPGGSQRLLGADTEAVFSWDGTFSNGTAAHNGAYTWKLVVSPLNGFGGRVERTGTLTVASGSAPHDYSDTGTPTLLVRDVTGHLSSYDVRQFVAKPTGEWERTERGGGWNAYDRLLSTGNIDATPYADVVARDRSGVLWLYSGKGRSFAAPVRIGGGWNTYDLLTGPGNLGGAAVGDLLARDRDGVLWLYLGKGDGTFAPRTRVGGDWGAYDRIVNIGDVDRDGRADLIAESGTEDYALLTVYKGTGDWKAPFRAGTALSTGAPYAYGVRPAIF
ncbi:FG-GAP repeat domain-containing protein [Streptomyces gardneri]|uniref:FG-GAP repeat domain-containing protein n=1 Tax=Streptomyces gardneri TaxID=66892 RepID=UPI0033DC7915